MALVVYWLDRKIPSPVSELAEHDRILPHRTTVRIILHLKCHTSSAKL